MKKIFLLIFFVGAGLVTTAQLTKQLYVTKSLAGEDFNKIMAKTSGGKIEVTGNHAGDARIEVYIQSANIISPFRSKKALLQRMEDFYELEITVANQQLTAIARLKDRDINWKEAVTISYKIYVPSAVSTELTTSGGPIHLENLTGTQHFTTSGGSLHLNKLHGKIHGKTSGGRVLIADSHEDINLHTSGGSIHANDCTGTIKLVTSGGRVLMANLQGTVHATTSGGPVHADAIDGSLTTHTSGGRMELKKLRGSLDASTSGGSMKVELLEIGDYVTISNSGGRVHLTLPESKGMDLELRGNKVKTTMLNNFSGSLNKNKINGALNGGGIPVKVRTSGGSITLTVK